MAHCFYAHQIYEILPERIHFFKKNYLNRKDFILFRACSLNEQVTPLLPDC